MIQITPKTTPGQIIDQIKTFREQKGKEKETLALIDRAITFGHDFVINLFWEEALTYQHMFMNNGANKAAMGKMEQAVLTAKFYIEKYKIGKWYPRLYRFLGRISDYKGEFSSSIGFYKKAIKFVNRDPEPHRKLELEAFLYFAIMMSGKTEDGYKKSKKLFADFESSKEGKALKRSDYQTWAIWRSGITVRTVGGLMQNKVNFNKTEANEWLRKTKKDLTTGEFSYRLKELKDLELKLRQN